MKRSGLGSEQNIQFLAGSFSLILLMWGSASDFTGNAYTHGPWRPTAENDL